MHSGFLFHKLPKDDGEMFYGTTLENAKSIGIHAWRAMTIDDSNVTAKGNTRAMNIAPTITNGTISAATPLPAGIPAVPNALPELHSIKRLPHSVQQLLRRLLK